MFGILYLWIWSGLIFLMFLGYTIFGVDPAKFSNETKFIVLFLVVGMGWIMIGIQIIMAKINNHFEEAKKVCPTCGKEIEK